MLKLLEGEIVGAGRMMVCPGWMLPTVLPLVVLPVVVADELTLASSNAPAVVIVAVSPVVEPRPQVLLSFKRPNSVNFTVPGVCVLMELK